MHTRKYTADDIKLVKSDEKLIESVDISSEAFQKNLNESIETAFSFARSLVSNELPDKIKYQIFMNCSYDRNKLEDGEVTLANKEQENSLIESESTEEVFDILWREGRVPEWVNVSVASEDGIFTYLQLACSGKFSNRREHMYHAHEGRAPFHVLGPPAPTSLDYYDDDQKYDLHWQKLSK